MNAKQPGLPPAQLYRAFLQVCNHLPREKRTGALLEVQTKFHGNKQLSKGEEIKKAVSEATSKLGYLRMVTPRRSSTSLNFKNYLASTNQPSFIDIISKTERIDSNLSNMSFEASRIKTQEEIGHDCNEKQPDAKEEDSTIEIKTQQKGKTYIVYQNGKAIEYGTAEERDKARYTNWDGNNLDPDCVKRHFQLLNRAGFKSNAHAKGFF